MGVEQLDAAALTEVLWGLICDPDHPQYRQAYETALELRRQERVQR